MQAKPILSFDSDLAHLIEDLFETMYEAPGVGLAAPQIGIAKRVFVADIGEGPFAMVNPEIVETHGKWKYEEGCLSVPDRYWHIKRHDYARAQGFGVDGAPVMFEGDELIGRVLQHEIDHLDGLLLLSHLGVRTKKIALKEMREQSLGITRSH